ncbi:MAG: phytanoyl-CoA dioxygenase family protein [Armatimonadetes bacterium]|nr:phytanoyl-CoA dioxygenase family protein [Armatimonadota bacterium]MDE2207310.1 phytanoyl-CoA dioxygenase family protein [Armatimonadota bacterium]
MEIREALVELGVGDDTITADDRERLDRDGYVRFPRLMASSTVEALRNRIGALMAEEQDRAGLEVHQEGGTERLSDLINKGSEFWIVISHPRVLAAVAHVLDYDLQLSSLNSRNALPGQGLQSLHADWGRRETPGYQVCNSFWLLDDFGPENGATRLVPGSHRGTQLPGDVMEETSATHPDEVVLRGDPGDVVVVNSHVWHGGTLNTSGRSRRVLHGYFCRRNQPQQLNQQQYLRPATWDGLTPAQRTVLGVTHLP